MRTHANSGSIIEMSLVKMGPSGRRGCAAHAIGEARVAALHFLEDRHCAEAGCGGQHRHDLGLEDIDERIGTAAPTWLLA